MVSRFILEKEVPLKEINAHLKQLRHEPTGAKILHLATDDVENSFCISFRTYPESDNGVAHILEHTVLCGSKKYPVKDPFFLMNRRSLNTFMNAFTGGDFTCYPAATQNKEDFYNLLDVYIDAVFFPSLNRLSFLQEGHRVEFEKSDDPSSPLKFKGVVYNEMKGSYASPERRFHEALNHKLFPTLIYGIDSGGKPEAIPSLSYDELLSFHDTYYHPSNALFYFYGNLPLEDHLKFLEERILSKVSPREQIAPLPREKRYTSPQQFQVPFPIGKEEDLKGKTRIGISWLTTHASDQLTSLALTVLLVALMDTDASPLKKRLLKVKEIKQVSSSIDTDCSEVPILLVFHGCEEGDSQKIEDETMRALKEIADQPIEPSFLEAAIHQIALHRTEISRDDLPWGLNLFMRAGLIFQQGGDPEEALKVHTLFDHLKGEWKLDPLYFNKILKKWLIENPHRVTLTLYPDTELGKKEEEQEQALLDSIKGKLTADSVQIILNDAEALHHLQEDSDGQEDLLPKISLSAIPEKEKQYPLKEEKLADLNLFHHEAFTNGLVYADLIFSIPEISEEEIPFLRILTLFLTQLGAGGKDYEQVLHQVQGKTGGIGASITVFLPIDNPSECIPSLQLSGKALEEDVEDLLRLMGDFIQTPDFKDDRRLLELWEKHTTSLFSSISSTAMKYTSLLAAASFSSSQNFSERIFGLDYIWVVSQWKPEEVIQKIRAGLEKLASLIFSQKGDLVITSSLDVYEKIKGEKAYGLGLGHVHGAKKRYEPLKVPPLKGDFGSQGRSFASPVSFISQVVPSVPFSHPSAPALTLASFILDNQTLHTEIRERGGAYGAGSRQRNAQGLFSFYSYRDPHIGETIETFKKSLENVVEEGIDDQEQEEALLELIQGLDSPISPGHRGMMAYGWLREGKTPEVRDSFRRKLLQTTGDQIVKSVEEHLLPSYPHAVTVVATGTDLLQKENDRRQKLGLNPLPIHPLDKRQ